MKFLKGTTGIKILSIAATALGIAGTLLSSYADGKKQEELIDQKVNEAIAEVSKKETES